MWILCFLRRIGNLKQLEEERQAIREQFEDRPIQHFTVGCLNVVDDMLKIYQEQQQICNHEVRVKFDGECGVDAGGLTHELFPVFWNSLQSIFFDGNQEKVPMVMPRMKWTMLSLVKSYHMASS